MAVLRRLRLESFFCWWCWLLSWRESNAVREALGT